MKTTQSVQAHLKPNGQVSRDSRFVEQLRLRRLASRLLQDDNMKMRNVMIRDLLDPVRTMMHHLWIPNFEQVQQMARNAGHTTAAGMITST